MIDILVIMNDLLNYTLMEGKLSMVGSTDLLKGMELPVLWAERR
jgi:hypothetical protein